MFKTPKKFSTIADNIRHLGPKKYIQYFIFQRIFRINSHVPWPVHWSSVVTNPDKIIREYPTANLGAMPSCYIQGINGIVIGKNSLVGPGVKIISANHNIRNYNIHDSDEPIKIGQNCWIGANVVILPGVELANHVIVASGSVVTRSFLEEDVVIGGVPARKIKKCESYSGDMDYFGKNKKDIE